MTFTGTTSLKPNEPVASYDIPSRRRIGIFNKKAFLASWLDSRYSLYLSGAFFSYREEECSAMEDSGVQVLLDCTSLSVTTYDLGTNVLEHAYAHGFPWHYILHTHASAASHPNYYILRPRLSKGWIFGREVVRTSISQLFRPNVYE